MNTINKLIKSYFFYTISAFSISLSIKANVGISCFNALNMALSSLTSMKVGTITALINFMFLLTYMVMTKFRYPKKYLLQLISVLLFGSLINLFTYKFLVDIHLQSYLFRLSLMAISTIISGLSIGMIISYGQITFPIESFCLALEETTGLSFVKSRYGIDILSVIMSLTITITFLHPLFVREGTLISLFLLSLSINFMKEYYKKRH